MLKYVESRSPMDDSYHRTDGAATVGIIPEPNRAGSLGKSRGWLVNLLIIGLPVLICIILLLIFMFATSIDRKPPYVSTRCILSAESNSSKLTATLKKIQTEYFRVLWPEKIYRKPGVKPEEIRATFRPWDPSPNTIKNKTDTAMKLLSELNSLKINTTLLKIRERKAVHIAKAILLNNNDWAPLGQNYYAGDWMLGPDFFCWQPICQVYAHLSAVIGYFKPHNLTDLKKLDELFDQVNETFETYIENLKLGVRTGYVRNKEACEVGLHNLQYFFYRNIALENETGVLKEAFSKEVQSDEFYDKLSKSDKKKWKDEYKEDVAAYFKRSLVTKIGNATIKMLRYMKGEHLSNCAPETVVSGLEKLPLSYVYKNLVADTNQPAMQKLPTNEPLQGSDTYKSLMRFFTTFDITPEKLRKMTQERLNELYPQAEKLAQDYTGIKNNVSAINAFTRQMQDQEMYFNDKPFPDNETSNDAFIKCYDDASAKAYCPKRYKAMQAWIKNSKEVENIIKPYLKNFLYDSGPKNCIPKCPVDNKAWYHPHSVFQAYFIGNKDCSFKAQLTLPFFVENFGPKWTEYTTMIHEFAGHHVEVQSFIEYFQSDCKDPVAWLNAPNYFLAITEGWAAYAEDQLYPEDTTLYSSKTNKTILRQKYGMLYYQLLHALRAMADIDLHFYGKQVSEIRELYRKYVWEDNNNQVNKDIRRIQSMPGFVTSYMIGHLEIERVRKMAEKELGNEFSLKDFHYEIFREGEFPLDYLEEHITAYIACKKNPTQIGCSEMI